MGTIANAKVTHYYNCYNGDFIGCLRLNIIVLKVTAVIQHSNNSHSDDILRHLIH